MESFNLFARKINLSGISKVDMAGVWTPHEEPRSLIAFERLWNWHVKATVVLSFVLGIATWLLSNAKKSSQTDHSTLETLANVVFGLHNFSWAVTIQGSVLRLMNPDRLEEQDEELRMTNPPPTTIVEYRKALQRRDMYIAKQKVMLASLRKKSMRLRRTKELHK
ncbi:hypothetical protein RHMOL_Rhmol07G0233800 [Rhododendron molle]|uniref:Uncharacterized protein n=1 Tax=Rhododendron molle TaxID=49168 RepID=A0ACC0N5T6_RHOML|nr:hypothetical protein RHMOL_Rhmol07G0233800 [Rhododendron molle]